LTSIHGCMFEMCVCWHAIPKYQYLFRALIARMTEISIGVSCSFDDLPARSRPIYRKPLLIKIYGSVKGEKHRYDCQVT